jgi:hypothetical protein
MAYFDDTLYGVFVGVVEQVPDHNFQSVGVCREIDIFMSVKKE